ncbi:Uncharacterised protein [Cedecea neteri]|uniref:Uncharacterized protein n=1 Tax=Cedecea neteri TaxID=158822 RepID=A0A2X3JD00_9ENTR|nr:Uncharacterised protein [Cedecea neteri]
MICSKSLNKDNDWLENEVVKQGFNKISEVYLGEYLSAGLIYTDMKDNI